MLSENNCITKLLGLKDVFVNSVEETENYLCINIETVPKLHLCPCCRQPTSYIHDYRIQKIKDLSFRGKFVYLLLKKRRYVCKQCGKRFNEKYSLIIRIQTVLQKA